MSTRRFPFEFGPRYRLPALVFGVTARTAYVEVDEVELRVRFGLWRLRTPLSNVTGTTTTGDYAFAKTAGPPHLSFVDRGITFATNGERGLCVSFAEAVRGIEPLGRIRHPAATLTVADPTGLAGALARRRAR